MTQREIFEEILSGKTDRLFEANALGLIAFDPEWLTFRPQPEVGTPMDAELCREFNLIKRSV